MNWLFVFAFVAIVFVLSRTGKQVITIRPDSTCGEFVAATNALLQRSDIDTLGIPERADMCKITSFMIKHASQCPDYDWVAASNKMRCDVSTEQGELTTDGVTMRA